MDILLIFSILSSSCLIALLLIPFYNKEKVKKFSFKNLDIGNSLITLFLVSLFFYSYRDISKGTIYLVKGASKSIREQTYSESPELFFFSILFMFLFPIMCYSWNNSWNKKNK